MRRCRGSKEISSPWKIQRPKARRLRVFGGFWDFAGGFFIVFSSWLRLLFVLWCVVVDCLFLSRSLVL